MPLYKCILTNNLCYKVKRTIIPRGIMVHSTGANNPSIKRYVQPIASASKDAFDPSASELLTILGVNKNGNDWNHTTREVGVHAFVGKLADGSVAAVQTLPWDHRGWHAAVGTKGTANDTHIAFEICEDGLTDKLYFEQTKNQAVELCAHLCKLYSLDPITIICHQDGYKLGIASNHADVYHWWNRYKYTMDDFRSEVASLLAKPDVKEEDDDMKYYKTLDDVPSYYRPTIEKLITQGALKGTGGDTINVSEDFCRVMTVLDRLGKL